MPKKKPTAKKPTADKPTADKPTAKKSGAAKAPPGRKPPKSGSPRPGGSRLTVFNSGLEVWLYDESLIGELKASGGMDFQNPSPSRTYEELTVQGLVVAYSLYQDDSLDVEVIVGAPLTEKELTVGRWLEPQIALLKLPTGTLAIESSDARRAGPEEPTEKGAVMKVPPGDYKLTLYRVDHEALDREGMKWEGPQEVIVLTKGGKGSDAADGILPFEPKRDLSWVGNYKISGTKAVGLAWFSDPWDTMTLNLDSRAVAGLGVATGSYLRTTVPAIGMSFVTVIGPNWNEARRLPPPAKLETPEYGFGAVIKMGDWNGAEALFCKRDTTEKAVKDKHQTLWLKAEFEVLEIAARTKKVPVAKPDDLRTKNYWKSPTFINTALCDVLKDAPPTITLPEALDQLDEQLAALGSRPLVDFSWEFEFVNRTFERCARLYAGHPDAVAFIFASEGRFDLFFLSKSEGGGWLATGKTMDLDMELNSNSDGSIKTQNIDRPIPTMWEFHQKRTAATKVAAVPEDTPARLKWVEGFLGSMSK